MDDSLLWRGRVALAHQPQMIRRDMTGETIAANFGGTALGYRLTEDQFAERRTTGRGGLPYEYLLYSPRSAAFNWTAFFNREEMDAWLEAYDCSVATVPGVMPGTRFTVLLPAGDANWLPLSEHEPDPDVTYLAWGGEGRIDPAEPWTYRGITGERFVFIRFTRPPNYSAFAAGRPGSWIAKSFLTIKKEQ